MRSNTSKNSCTQITSYFSVVNTTVNDNNSEIVSSELAPIGIDQNQVRICYKLVKIFY